MVSFFLISLFNWLAYDAIEADTALFLHFERLFEKRFISFSLVFILVYCVLFINFFAVASFLFVLFRFFWVLWFRHIILLIYHLFHFAFIDVKLVYICLNLLILLQKVYLLLSYIEFSKFRTTVATRVLWTLQALYLYSGRIIFLLNGDASIAHLIWNWIKLSLSFKFYTGELYLHSFMLGHRGVFIVDICEGFKRV